ncbi:TPA: DNA-binding protein [Candidatus Woesearchaeota archaeon]|nr:DNA-binding protein [Candidatus Woesearchaeota archaeon]
MKIHATRLRPGQELEESIKRLADEKDINAGFIISCVGSLKTAMIRFAERPEATRIDGPLEIIQLSGTFSKEGIHLHMSVSDQEGRVIGGHVKKGCVVHTTAEIIIGEDEDKIFMRIPDEETGYKELQVQEKRKG